MIKFCSQCGTRVENAKFCPNCGAPINPPPAHFQEAKRSPSIQEIMSSDKKYIILMAFPILYLISLLCGWFRFSIPLLGTESFHIFDLLRLLDESFNSDFRDLLGYSGNGIMELFTKFIAITILLLACFFVYFCIRSLIFTLKKDKNAMSYCSNASLIAIICGGLAIISVWFLNLITEGGYKLLEFTFAPVFIIAAGIIGKVVADKMSLQVK